MRPADLNVLSHKSLFTLFPSTFSLIPSHFPLLSSFNLETAVATSRRVEGHVVSRLPANKGITHWVSANREPCHCERSEAISSILLNGTRLVKASRDCFAPLAMTRWIQLPNLGSIDRIPRRIVLTRHSRNQDLFSFMLHIVLHDAVCYGHEPVYATPRR